MGDVRKGAECEYCGAEFHIKYTDDMPTPQFCCFCGESFDVEVEDDEEDDDFEEDEVEEDY